MSEDYQALSSTGMKYFHKKEYVLAADYFSRAAEGAKASQQDVDEAEIRNNLSVTHLMAGNAHEAYEAALGTDKVFSAHEDFKRQAMALGNIAQALEELKDYPQALSVYDEAIALLKGRNFNEIRSVLLRRKSAVQRKMGDTYQAVASLDTSIDEKPRQNLNDRFLKQFLDRIFLRKKA
jgi:tetratricopeptide (TPR) repeat protein